LASISPPDDVSRRRFLSGIIAAVAGAVATLVGVPAIAYIASPGFKEQNPSQWLTLGPVTGLTPGIPTGFPFARKIKDGWTETSQTGVAFAVTHDGQNVKVYSDVCTHLGCRVTWHEDRQMYISPCHNGLFSIDGEVLGGPPPRPLDQFQTRIENGQIKILLA